MINKDKTMTQYKSRDLVYLISPLTSLLISSSTKFKIIYMGSLVVHKIIEKNLVYFDGH